MTQTASLPMSFDALTADWVTQALAERYPGTIVTKLTLGKTISGTGSKAQLFLEYNNTGQDYGLPASMYAKGGFDWHAQAVKASYIYEAKFWADWAPQITANIPKGYYGGWNDDQGVSLMEDLADRNAHFGSGDVTPLSLDVMEKVVTMLAELHAGYWEAPQIKALRTLGERIGTDFAKVFLEPGYYAKCISEPRGSAIPKAFHDPNKVLVALEANWARVLTGPQTFVHGDAHQGNLFFEPDGAPGYLDFAAYVRCSGLHDVNYAVTGALSIDDRRAHDCDLLQLYLNQLRRLGVQNIWDDEEAWSRYRQHTMHGMLWFATPVEMQPIPVIEVHGHRFGTAASDYDLGGLSGI